MLTINRRYRQRTCLVLTHQLKEMNIEFKQLWPTTIGSGKFDVDGLVEHIFTNYNLADLTGEVDGGNIF